MDFAVDSNCICGFQSERVQSAPGAFTEAVEKLFLNGSLILDEGGHCRQEWLQTATGPVGMNLADWISDQLVGGRLKFVLCRPLGLHRRQLSQLGLPTKDMKWFALCRDGRATIFLTEDIDFYEPRAKAYPPARRERIKCQGPAPVKRFFLREIGTKVLDVAQVAAM